MHHNMRPRAYPTVFISAMSMSIRCLSELISDFWSREWHSAVLEYNLMVVMVKNFDKSLFNLRNTSVHVSATNYYPEQLALQSSSFGYIFRKYLKIIGTAILALHAVARAPYDDRLTAPLLPFQLDVVHDV